MSTSTNVSSSDGQSLVNVTLESCAGKFEDYSSPKHTGERCLEFFERHHLTPKYLQALLLHNKV